MSDSDIPLLTDVVDELEDDELPSDEIAEARKDTGQAEPERIEVLVRELEEFAIFEADDSRPGDTATHYVPTGAIEPDAVADAAAEAAESRMAREDDFPDAVRIDDVETVIAELQTRIASHTYELTDELMRAAFSDFEARVFRVISTHLRQQLPELIDAVVREHLLEHSRRDENDE